MPFLFVQKFFRVIYRVIHLRNISEKQEKYFFLKIKNNAKNGLIPSVLRKCLIYRDFLKVAMTGSSPVSRLTKTLEYSRVLFICVIFRVIYF